MCMIFFTMNLWTILFEIRTLLDYLCAGVGFGLSWIPGETFGLHWIKMLRS